MGIARTFIGAIMGEFCPVKLKVLLSLCELQFSETISPSTCDWNRAAGIGTNTEEKQCWNGKIPDWRYLSTWIHICLMLIFRLSVTWTNNYSFCCRFFAWFCLLLAGESVLTKTAKDIHAFLIEAINIFKYLIVISYPFLSKVPSHIHLYINYLIYTICQILC